MKSTLCIGTAGMSVWFSDDEGETWQRPYTESGLYLEARVWALAGHPDLPDTVFAGTDVGLYRGNLREKTWTHLPSPMDGKQIWALAIDPANADHILAGTLPAAIYQSLDGGRSWSQAQADFASNCIYVGSPRITQILFDPEIAGRVHASVEIDGIYVSDDGGATWRKAAGKGLVSEDIHGLAVTTTGARRLWAAANKGLHLSLDDGATFEFRPLDAPAQYTRFVGPRADGDAVVFLTNGNGPPGDSGRLLRSLDQGETWRSVSLPGHINSTIWCMAMNPADPNLIYCASNLGQLYRSRDGGESWDRLGRELGEVRSIFWAPSS